MRGFRTTSARPTLLGRFTAWSGVALVGFLAWLSVDPAAHTWLHEHAQAVATSDCGHHHGHDHGRGDQPWSADDDSGCVITQFAQGQVELAITPLWMPGALAASDALVMPTVSAPAGPWEHRLPPACGPPVS